MIFADRFWAQFRRSILLTLGIAGLCFQPVLAQPSTLSNPNQQQGSDSNWQDIKAQADAQTAAYNAMKAAAEARSAAIQADINASTASLGNVKGQTVIQGTITPGTNPGAAESLLLTARAMGIAAAGVAAEVRGSRMLPTCDRAREPSCADPAIMVVTSTSDLAVNEALQFDMQTRLLETALTSAQSELDNALASVPSSRDPGTRSALPAAGALLNSLSGIGSFFQSDYSFGSASVTLPTALTPAVVAAALRTQLGSRRAILIPSHLVASDMTPLFDRIGPLQALYLDVAGKAAQAKQLATSLRTSNAAVAGRLDAAEGRANRVITAFESFSSALTAVTAANAEAPIIRIARQYMIRRQLQEGAVVLLVTTQNAGAYYTRRNLWTFLGGPPMHTMGGVVIAYSLYQPATGEVHTSGQIPIHGGYRSVRAVERMFQPRSETVEEQSDVRAGDGR